MRMRFCDALESGHLSGAGLDVVTEPPAKNSRLAASIELGYYPTQRGQAVVTSANRGQHAGKSRSFC